MAKERISRFVISLDEQGARIEDFARRSQQATDKAGKGWKGVQTTVKAATATIAAIGAAIGTGSALLFRLTADAARTGDELAKMSRRTGVTVEDLSKLKFAADLSGTSIEGLETGLKRASRVLLDATRGLETGTRPLNALGISATDSQGRLREMSDFLPEVADALKGVQSQTERAALAQELFGRSGAGLLPLLQQGSEAMRQQFEQAEELGLVYDDLSARKAEEFIDAQARVRGALDSVKRAFVEEIMPVLTAGMNTLATSMGENTDEAHAWGKAVADVVVPASESLSKGAILSAGVLDALRVTTSSVGLAITSLAEGYVFLTLTQLKWQTLGGRVATETARQNIADLEAMKETLSGMRESFADSGAAALENLGSIGGKFDEVNEFTRRWREELQNQLNPGLMDTGEAAEDAGEGLDTVAGGGTLSKDALEALAYNGLDPTLARLQQLIEMGAGTLKPFQDLAYAAEQAAYQQGILNDVLEATATGPPSQAPALIDTLDRSMERYGVRIPDVNREIAQLNNLWESGQVPAKQMAEIVKRQHDELAALGVLTPDTKAQLDALIESTGNAAGSTRDWNGALLEVFGTIRTGKQWLDNFIGSVTSFIGSLLSGQGPLGAFENSLAGIGGLLGGFGGTGGGIAGNILGALGSGGPLAGLLGGGGGALAGTVGFTGAVGGATSAAGLVGGGAAATGGGIFGGLGGALGGLFSNPFTGIAAGIGLGGFGLYKLLTKSREEARGERQSGIFGAFQVPESVLDSLTDLSIRATKAGRELPDTIASIVGFDDVLRAVGITTQDQFNFAMQKGDEALQRLKEGLITGGEAAEFFGTESLTIMQQAAEALGASGVAAFQQMIDKAMEAGIIIPEEFQRAMSETAEATQEEWRKVIEAARTQQADLLDQLAGARGRERIEIEKALEDLQQQIAIANQEAANQMQEMVDNAAIAGRSISDNLQTGFQLNGPARATGDPFAGGSAARGAEIIIRSDGLSRLADAFADTLDVSNDRRRAAVGGY
jgi:hypothetical protein